MKKLIQKLKLGVLLTGLLFLFSCSNTTTVITEIGLQAIYRKIPSVAVTATRYTEHKISEYLRSSSSVNRENKVTGKKAEKGGVKARSISIAATREARLV